MATSDHVPSVSPLVDTLESALTRLGFGAPGADVKFDLFGDLQRRGLVQLDILARLTVLDVFLAGRIAKGDMAALTTVFERLCSIFSTGNR